MTSIPQIARLAMNAGFKGTVEIGNMTAIAMAESGGDPSAIGDVNLQDGTWGPSVGLWQIRSLNSEKGKGTTRDQIANMDPQVNANHARTIFLEQGYGAWSTFNGTRYRMYLPATASAAAVLVGGDAATGATDKAGDAVSGVTDAVNSASSTVSEAGRMLKWLQSGGSWIRILKGVIGVAVVVGAAMVAVGPSVPRMSIGGR
jgi:hypothetical protein